MASQKPFDGDPYTRLARTRIRSHLRYGVQMCLFQGADVNARLTPAAHEPSQLAQVIRGKRARVNAVHADIMKRLRERRILPSAGSGPGGPKGSFG